ncbi:MAG: FTR1 family iron permease [Burkholderiaceae bacterium]|jgi:high-affinity iron transporter|nr:FTR1 family iron permease [Burkholderiaceae bacterium]
MLKKSLIAALLAVAAWLAQATTGDYEVMISDIEGRLERTSQAYRKQQIEEAKSAVQMAYFEVFENLEGPIRINFSAARSFEMEAAFGEIRRMIMDGRPADEVDARIGWLKQQLRAVQPKIEAGHTLQAQGTHGAFENDRIAAYWHEHYRLIDDMLAEAVGLYQQGQGAQARAKIQQAQFDGFKNSEMEIAIRTHRSSRDTQKLNQAFSALMDMASAPGQMTRFGYAVTTLLQDIEEQLEDLPVPASAQANAMADPATADGAASGVDWAQVARDIDAAIARAIALYEGGQAQAAIGAVQDSYFDLFEASGMESRVGARDAAAKLRMEGHFTRLIGLMKAQKPLSELQAQAQALSTDVAQAAAQLGGSGAQTPWALALMSLVIILREGLEALLIVAAIVAYLVKNEHRDKLPLIRQSVIVALAASFLTAAAFYALFKNAGAQRELLEGFTMIVAVVVLFGMSYWLISKAEAERWKAYLDNRISAALLSKGSLFGLWFASFLAVYREGAETVLFYQALLADASGMADYMALLGGFALGCAILVAVYFVMRFSVVKLPLKPFFIVTGGFMYLMAFVFAGKSVMELIEGKLFTPTLWSQVPEIPLLGIHPYRETVIPQLVLVLAAVVALLVMRGRRPGPPAHSPAAAEA